MKTTLLLLTISLLSLNSQAGPIDTLIQKLDYKKLIVEEKQYSPPLVTNLTQDAAIQDFTAMAFGLKYAYIGYDTQAKTFDWDKYFNSTLATLKTKQSWQIKDFINVTGQVLDQIDDGHMAIWTIPNIFYQRKNAHWQAYIAADANQNGAITKRACRTTDQQDILENQNFVSQNISQKISVLLARTEMQSIQCTSGEVKVRELLAKHDALPTSFYESPLGDFGYYLRMSSFAKTNVQDIKSFMDSAAHAVKSKNVILDLRGNGGGDPIYFAEWMSSLKTGQAVQVWPKTNKMTSFANSITGYNSVYMLLNQLKQNGADADLIDQHEAYLKEQKSQFDYLFQTKQFRFKQYSSSEASSLPASENMFGGEIYILVDSQCFSACEVAVNTANLLKNVHVVGVNTGGINAFGDPMDLKLPNSGIYVSLPSDIMMNIGPNGTSAEGRGLPPDLWVEGDSLPALINYIKAKSSKK